MGLFSRRSRASKSASGHDGDTAADEAESTAGTRDVEEPPTPEDAEQARKDGPFDDADAPEGNRLDLGAVRVPLVEGMEVRMEVDKTSRVVTAANFLIDGSAMQVQVFAAPKSRGLWDDIRGQLITSIKQQGGTVERREGDFGTELSVRLPVRRADGRTGYRPARFVGIDGPRWFLRAVISGRAINEADLRERLEDFLRDTVVVRGKEAMAPQDLIPMALPAAPGESAPAGPRLEEPSRGPEITEVR